MSGREAGHRNMDSGIGPGASNEGYEGAHGLFKNLKGIAAELNLLPEFDMSGSAKAAAEAFLDCTNGTVASSDALFHHGQLKEFPRLNIQADVPAATDAVSNTSSPLTETGQSMHQFFSNLGPMFENMFSGPAGMLGSLLSFLFEIFSTIATAISNVLTELSRAAAAIAEKSWKRHIEELSSTVAQGNTQYLEL